MVLILPYATPRRSGTAWRCPEESKPSYYIWRLINMDAIVSLFSNLAVPVACLIATFYLWNKEREDHKQEQKELTEAIANNTLVMQKLVDKLDKND